MIDLVLVFASSTEDSLMAALDGQVQAQLTGAEYGAPWSSMKPLQQRICLRIARGEDVTSLAARREYAYGSKRAEVSPGTVNDALRAMVSAHVLNKSTGGRGDYRIDDPLFAEWVKRESDKLAPSR